MAIILKDGFEFIDIKGDPEAFIVKGENLSSELNYIIEHQIKSIYLTYFKSKNIHDLNFLEKITHVEKININGLNIDYSGLYHLENLKEAILNSSQTLEFSRFRYLECLAIDWSRKFPDLSLNKYLKSLSLWKYRPVSKTLDDLHLPEGLEKLEIVQSNITSLEKLEITNLLKLELHYCNLLTLKGIEHQKQIKELIIENCKKIINYENIESCNKLSKIIIGDSGDLKSINWLKKLKNVKHFSFIGTKLLNNDTSPCIGIDYVSFSKNNNYNYNIEKFRNLL